MSNGLTLFLELLAIASLLIGAAVFVWWRYAGPRKNSRGKRDLLPPSVRHMSADEVTRQSKRRSRDHRTGGNSGGSA